jgi:hypothetical protein
MSHSFTRSHPFLVVVAKKMIEKIKRFRRDKTLIFTVDEFRPRFGRITAKNVIEMGIELNLVLIQVPEEGIGTEDFGNFYELIVIV